jgi:plasmid maintenance system antidote protein VapI
MHKKTELLDTIVPGEILSEEFMKPVYPTPVNWPKNIDIYLRSKFSSLQDRDL